MRARRSSSDLHERARKTDSAAVPSCGRVRGDPKLRAQDIIAESHGLASARRNDERVSEEEISACFGDTDDTGFVRRVQDCGKGVALTTSGRP